MLEEDYKELWKEAFRMYLNEVWLETSELMDLDETVDESSLGYEAGSRAARFATSAVRGLRDFEKGGSEQ